MPTPPRGCSIQDYVADVSSVADDLATPPVVVGHSMGGFVVQKYLESRYAPAGVLLASIPPRGTSSVVLRAAAKQLLLSTQHLATTVANRGTDRLGRRTYRDKLIRATLFSRTTPEPDIDWCIAHLEESLSLRAVLDMAILDAPRRYMIDTPLLVLGAANDGLVSTRQVRATARAYRSPVEFFADTGHDMMLEPRWMTVAQRMDDWLAQHNL